MNAEYTEKLPCWVCSGSGQTEPRVLRVSGVSHRPAMTTRCFTCKGSGKVDNPNRRPEPQVLGEFPDWMNE